MRMPLGALLGASAVSQVGSQLTVVALPWFVLESTGSAAKAGLAGAAILASRLVFGFASGPLVDRFSYRTASVAADGIGAVGIALVPFLHRLTGLPFWQLLLAVCLSAAGDLPGLSARRAMLPALARLAHTRIERANGAFEGLEYLGLILGAPLAGVLIAGLGASNVLWIDAATFAAAALAVAVLVPAGQRRPAAPVRRRYAREALAGIRMLWRDRLLRTPALSLAATNLVGAASVAVVLPVYVREHVGDPVAFGIFVGAFGAGALAGALIYSAWGHRLPRRAIWLLAFMLAPLEYWILVVGPGVALIAAALFIVGVAGGVINPLTVTVRQERTSPADRGRIFTNFSVVVATTPPLGVLAAGLLVTALGLDETVIALAIAGQLVAALLLLLPSLRDLDRPPPNSETPAVPAPT